MNSKKQRTKNRRRARKLADQAWDSVDADNLDMAMKLIRRALDAHAGNAVVWNDRGLIHLLREEVEQAIHSFQSAIGLAPEFAEPYAHLAGIAIQQGNSQEAAKLMSRAASLQPANATYAELAQAYESAAGAGLQPTVQPSSPAPKLDSPLASHVRQISDDCDWLQVAQQLTELGLVRLPKLLREEDCEMFRDMFHDSQRFAKQVVMDKPSFGKGVYKYFRSPIPKEIAALRCLLYGKLVSIVNDWMRLLGKPEFPAQHVDFLKECTEAGQTSPTPLLLKYGKGGFNTPHRDLRGEVCFPLQLAIVLSPQQAIDGRGFDGGEFFLRDDQSSKHCAVERPLTLGLGDAVVFCTRDRLTPFLDQYALLPVSHGAKPVTRGERFVLAVPFHDYLPKAT